MPGLFHHRQLLPIISVFLTFAVTSATAEEPVRVEFASDEVEAPQDVDVAAPAQPAAAFPMGRIDPVPVEPEYDPLFDDYDEEMEEPESELLYQHDIGVTHLRRVLQKRARDYLKSAALAAVAAE